MPAISTVEFCKLTDTRVTLGCYAKTRGLGDSLIRSCRTGSVPDMASDSSVNTSVSMKNLNEEFSKNIVQAEFIVC